MAIVTIEDILKDIKNVAEEYGKDFVVAFSGGMDSTASALLCAEAIGKENIELVHVVYGPYTYSNSLEIVSEFAEKFGFKITFLYNRGQEQIWKYGPSCNMCTKQIKMGTVLSYANGRIVVTGSNSSDTWGQTGLRVFNSMYAPLGDIGKDEIRKILDKYGVKIRRIGEHALREGCKLKHLLKPMTNPAYHGKATAIANEMVLDYFPNGNEIANIKIVGPLSKNIAVINVKPFREEVYKLAEDLRKIDVIDDVIVADKPLILKIVANPSIYRVEESKFWVVEGKLKPEFAVPIKVEWYESKNNKLRTFHVVEVCEWTNYETEKDEYLKNSNVDSDTLLKIKCSCSMPSAIQVTHTNSIK
ncbi:ExsB family protein [Fervidobacterium nodosum]|uniref:ExsB family protein n=1 Tax=Fervidobacterium nodosum (strain ATCC 35602 / DSM 5306 / Rt17-B1) TaxID=381764 RepID=A7HLZ5_FERNB|nr:ExsB family protein [Fervidobacterium nodosum]ABS60928.1 ExsB family protein [Fervidobacterium nodosum Rt17-B1]